MGGDDHDQHASLTDFEPPEAVNDRQIANLKLLQRLRGLSGGTPERIDVVLLHIQRQLRRERDHQKHCQREGRPALFEVHAALEALSGSL